MSQFCKLLYLWQKLVFYHGKLQYCKNSHFYSKIWGQKVRVIQNKVTVLSQKVSKINVVLSKDVILSYESAILPKFRFKCKMSQLSTKSLSFNNKYCSLTKFTISWQNVAFFRLYHCRNEWLLLKQKVL